jgi:glycosyltransferase involved in cell wall biosynthesis
MRGRFLARYRPTSGAGLEAKIDALAAELGRAQEMVTRSAQETAGELNRLRDIIQLLYDREPELRERLGLLRDTPEYSRAFDDPQPLVSVVIPTYDRGDLLLSRAIPSVLAQTYPHLEVVIVGDCAPPDTGRRIAELGDSRLRYENLGRRGPYPQNPRDLWHVAGIPARNRAVTLARGSWIAPLDDDDAFHPAHIERLLRLAQEGRHEVAYGLLRCVMNDGSEFPLGTFPPELGHFGWQGAIFHAGLRFFEMELADALFFSPADWSLCRRMLRAGARFAFLDEIVSDHYESRFAPKYDAGD